MSEDLSIQGPLAETTVPDLCRSLIRSGETGVVALETFGRRDNIYFVEGKIVSATSSDPDLGLGEVLLRTGDINLKQYLHAIDEAGIKPIGSILFELGYLKMDELARALEIQIRTIVMNAFAFRAGNYTVEFASDFPAEVVSLQQINTERLVMDATARIEHWSLISRGIFRMSRTLKQTSGSGAKLFHLDHTEEEGHVYSLLAEPQSVEELCNRSYLANFVTCRTAWALLAANLVTDAEGEGVSEQRAALESEIELESEVEKYNSAFQALFDLVFQRVGDHTYDFVDRVATHLSDQTFPYLSGINLMNEGRVDFDQLLNNLIASGSDDRRAIVQNVLNELLTGWIFETRLEFGSTLESEVNAIVQKVRK
ncbi:MAG TPA: DUF4388 domain-containing protein [Thermoanaerobaculia bacterium]